MGLAGRIAQGEVAEDKTGHTAVFNDVFGGAHDDGGNAVCFEVACGQTDRLVADRSVRHQDREIDFILLK
jgi:hypothetical protein